jgi:hypothetical protein
MLESGTVTGLYGDGRTVCPSAAASAPEQPCQKASDLAREAVGCMGVFGTLARRSE